MNNWERENKRRGKERKKGEKLQRFVRRA